MQTLNYIFFHDILLVSFPKEFFTFHEMVKAIAIYIRLEKKSFILDEMCMY